MTQKQTPTRRVLQTLALLGLFVAVGASAQSDPLTIVVGYPAGGPTDLIARKLAATIQEQARRTVIVENKPGAAGGVAATFVTNVVADGNIIFLHNSYPQNAKTAALEPVVQIAETALGLWAKPNTRPGATNIAFGAAPPAYAFLGGNKNGFDQWVRGTVMLTPYRGAAHALADTIAGNADYFLGELIIGDGATHAGLVLVASSSARVAQSLGLSSQLNGIPNVPEFAIPLGVFVPAGTPGATKQLLRANIYAAVATPGFRAVLQNSSYTEATRPPEALANQLNEFATLAQRAINAGADIPTTALLSVPTLNRPSNTTAAPTPDDPKVFGRSARGG